MTSDVKIMSSDSAAFTSGSTAGDRGTSFIEAVPPTLWMAASIFSADARHTHSKRSWKPARTTWAFALRSCSARRRES